MLVAASDPSLLLLVSLLEPMSHELPDGRTVTAPLDPGSCSRPPVGLQVPAAGREGGNPAYCHGDARAGSRGVDSRAVH